MVLSYFVHTQEMVLLGSIHKTGGIFLLAASLKLFVFQQKNCNLNQFKQRIFATDELIVPYILLNTRQEIEYYRDREVINDAGIEHY